MVVKLQPGTTLAMPAEVYSEKGHKITLDYQVVGGTPRLTSIRDQSRRLFSLVRESFSVPERPLVKEVIRLVLNPDASDSSRVEYQMELDQNLRVTSVRLPTALPKKNEQEQTQYPYPQRGAGRHCQFYPRQDQRTTQACQQQSGCAHV